MKTNKVFSLITVILLICCVGSVQSIRNCSTDEIQAFVFQVIKHVSDEGDANTQPCVAAGQGPGIFTPVGTARAYGSIIEAMFNVYALTERYVRTTIAQDEFDDRYPSTTCTVLLQQMLLAGRRIYNFILPSSPLPVPNLLQSFAQEEGYDILKGSTEDQIKNLGGTSFELDALLITNLLRDTIAVDGSNQQGCYADTSNYFPVNPPTNLTTLATVQASAANLRATNHWSQEIRQNFINTPRAFLTPQAIKIPTFSQVTGGGFMLRNFISDTELHNQMLSLLDYQKTLASRLSQNRFRCEYWSFDTINTNGEIPYLPLRSLPGGHWLEITIENVIKPQNVPGQKPKCDLDCTMRLLLGVSKATSDAGIVAWQNKRVYDTPRASTYIPTLTGSTTPEDNQFRGPYCPFGTVQRYQWQPYQALDFITPAFPGFPSGHSTFGGAAAEVLTRLTKSDYFPQPLAPLLKRGRSKFEPQCFPNGTNSQGQSCQYKTCPVDISYDSENLFYPSQDVTLGPYYTFLEAAVDNGYARLYCGVHILADNLDGLAIGKVIGEHVYERIASLYEW